MAEEGGVIVDKFLQEHKYIDFSAPNIKAKAIELFDGLADNVQKAKVAYEFVRDKIPHVFDIRSDTIVAKASEVLEHKTGICHSKANLLAALLRLQGIPTGFCFQRLVLSDDNSQGYAVHCYNAVYIDGRWIKVDARGNNKRVNAQFSLDDNATIMLCDYPPNETVKIGNNIRIMVEFNSETI